jgi:hypothetical protein
MKSSKPRTSVFDAEQRDEDRVDDEDNTRPEIDLEALALGRRLQRCNQREH